MLLMIIKAYCRNKEKLGDKVNSKVSIIRFVPGDVRIYQKFILRCCIK